MAKRYATFEQLTQVTGTWKPGGTLGSHHAVVTHKGDTTVVDGSASGRVILRAGDTVGYNCGAVWRVPRPDEYRDPVRRVLAEGKVSQKALVYSDESVREYHGSSGYVAQSGEHRTTYNTVVVLGRTEKTYHAAEHAFDPEYTEYSGGDALVELKGDGQMGRSSMYDVRKYVVRVVVRPAASRPEVIAWLRRVFHLPGARDAWRAAQAAELEQQIAAIEAVDFTALLAGARRSQYNWRSTLFEYEGQLFCIREYCNGSLGLMVGSNEMRISCDGLGGEWVAYGHTPEEVMADWKVRRIARMRAPWMQPRGDWDS